MGGYLAYTERKDSGIEWLGEIPVHWQAVRVNDVTSKITNGYVGPTRDILVDSGVRYIQSLHIKNGKILFHRGSYYVEESWSNQHKKSRLNPNDVLLVQTGDIGQTALVTEEYAGCNCHALIIMTPVKNKVTGAFFEFFLRSHTGQSVLSAIQTGALHPHLNCGLVKDVKFAIPPISEQQQIAAFLDYKTAQIDALIAKKEALLEKLAEKRTALISQAVTKGLDPTVPMKDSGIEWLGEIPEHWEVVAFRHLLKEGTQNGLYKSKEHFQQDGVAFIQMGEAFSDSTISKTAKDRVCVSEAELRKWALEKGDLIFARRSLVFEGSGKCSIVGSLSEPHIYESSMLRARIDRKKLDPKFAFQYFNSSFSRAQMLSKTKRVTISGIDSQQLKSTFFSLPPIEEQKQISQFIKLQDLAYSESGQKIETAMFRLKEYRTALITNAVTGKIDVRDIKLPKPAKLEAVQCI